MIGLCSTDFLHRAPLAGGSLPHFHFKLRLYEAPVSSANLVSQNAMRGGNDRSETEANVYGRGPSEGDRIKPRIITRTPIMRDSCSFLPGLLNSSPSEMAFPDYTSPRATPTRSHQLLRTPSHAWSIFPSSVLNCGQSMLKY